jgi:hypothetical protein
MADQVQWRGGSRENSDDFTGAPREVTVDTTDWVLRVHDGIKPGGHKMMKVNNCLVVETADKCDPTKPSCKVTINGDLEVHGDTELDDTVIRGNLVVDGNFIQNGATLAVNTGEVILTNPGPVSFQVPVRATGCSILPKSPNLKTQEDANQYINECLRALENKWCDWTSGTIDELLELKDDLEKMWIAIHSIENRTDDLEARMDAVEAQITQILLTITTIEQEVEANQDTLIDHEGRIAALEALGGNIHGDINNLETELKNLIAALNDKVDALVLDDLVDVDAENALPGQVLIFGSQQWSNVAAPWVLPNSYIPSLTTIV